MTAEELSKERKMYNGTSENRGSLSVAIDRATHRFYMRVVAYSLFRTLSAISRAAKSPGDSKEPGGMKEIKSGRSYAPCNFVRRA